MFDTIVNLLNSTITLSDVVLSIAALLLTLVLISWHTSKDQFDLRWLIVDSTTEKVSLFKTGQLVALLTSTWAFIHEVRGNHLSEWLFFAYVAAWGGVNIANKIVSKETPPASK